MHMELRKNSIFSISFEESIFSHCGLIACIIRNSLGLANGSVGKDVCHQAWQPDYDSLESEWQRETFISCSLTLHGPHDVYMLSHMCIHAHIHSYTH